MYSSIPAMVSILADNPAKGPKIGSPEFKNVVSVFTKFRFFLISPF